MDEQTRQRATQIARNLLEMRIGPLEATRALVPFLHTDRTVSISGDRNQLLAIYRETDDLPVGRIREEWHPDTLLEKDKEVARYEKLYGDRVRSICERLLRQLEAIKYIGPRDFHNGFVRSVRRNGDEAAVTVEGDTGKRHIVNFNGVTSIEMSAPQGMELYAVSEARTELAGIQCYDFINLHFDEPSRPKSAACLRIPATGFTIGSIKS